MSRRLPIVAVLFGCAWAVGFVWSVWAAEPTKQAKSDAAKPAADGKAAAGTDAKASAEAKARAEQFIRLVKDKAGTPTAMQTAVARYTATEGKYAGVTVDLIGAVHVGEKSYYGKLNDLFTKY